MVLETIDQRWREHLYEMGYLEEGIWLRATAQKDTRIVDQKEGYDLFQTMTVYIREPVFARMFQVQVTVIGGIPKPVGDLSFSGSAEADMA